MTSTAAHHRDAIRASKNLLQLVGDKDHSISIAAQLGEDSKESFHFVWGQAPCRLVEDENLCICQQEFEHLHFLFFPNGESPDQGRWVHLKVESFRNLLDSS